jgi:hypothetical protein
MDSSRYSEPEINPANVVKMIVGGLVAVGLGVSAIVFLFGL